ncbi:MAG: hypothetical protein M9932_07830 [Xanthobacteraceae bacterium]|nr:hypothetical protein [Xanthobacteraceae bacterium]
MRKAGTSRPTMLNPFRGTIAPTRLSRAVRIGVATLGVGLVLGGHIAHAQDSDDDDSTFEEKIIRNIMSGIGATNGTESGIEYRERSPLVIPPKIDLPPPQSAAAATPANWPKDVDAAERKRIRAAEKKRVMGAEGARPLTPKELAVGTTKHVAATEPLQPGVTSNPVLMPSQLGYKGTLLDTMFGGSKTQSAPFTGEPEREQLTQPPPGYQTPSPNFAYGTGPKQPLAQQGVYDIQTGKEVK